MSSDARAFDGADDGFHEIQLNGKQLVFLGMATTLVSVVIFLCGVLVGRGVKPIDTVAQAAGPQTFDTPVTPATVPPGAISTPAPAPAPPTPPASARAATTAAAAAAAPAEDDTQPTPVGDDPETAASPAAERAAPAAAKPSIESRAAAAKPTPKPEAPKPVAKPAQVTSVPPAVKPATPTPAPAPAAIAKPAAAPAMASAAPASTGPASTTPATTSGGAIAVQVGAFKTRGEADSLAKRLSGKGYAAYVVNPNGAGKPVYRVRVGNYASADEAKSVSDRLTQQEKLKPWITR
jgi:cell division septation protein DedD